MKRSWFAGVAVGLTVLFWTAAVGAAPPKVVESVPADGATGVSPDIGRILIIFDRNMKMNSWSLMEPPHHLFPPMIRSEAPWIDPLTFELRVRRLEPQTTYAIQLNSEKRSGFQAADDQEPLPVTVITFTTGDGATGQVMDRDVEDGPPPASTVDQAGQAGHGGMEAVDASTGAVADSKDGGPGTTLIFDRVTEPNEQAYSLLVPKGWLTRGGIFRISAVAANGPGNAIAAKNDFAVMKDEAGTVMLRFLPDISYADGQVPAMFPVGANYAGMEVRPLEGARTFLVQLVRAMRPAAENLRVTGEYPVQTTVEAFARIYQPVNNHLVQLGMPPIRFDGARLVVEYREQGRSYREELGTVIIDFRHGAFMWTNSRTYAFRAPRETFAAWRKVLAITFNSVKIDPRWLSQELAAVDARSRQVVQAMARIREIEAEITAHRQKTNQEIMHENYLALTGQEDFINPYTKEVEQDTNEYRRRWVGLDGDIIYTNDTEFDPNIVTHRTDFKLSRVRPR